MIGVAMGVKRTWQEVFDEVVDFLRKSVCEMEDFRLSVRLAAAIASVTKNPEDINLAVSMASNHDTRSLRGEAMAIVAKTLAEGLQLEEARSVANSMRGLDTYWIAEAWIWIARFSGQKKDKDKAEEAISDITSPVLRNEAREDLKLLLKRHHHTGTEKDEKHLSDLRALQDILSRLKGMEDSHVISPKFTSTHLRFKASEIVDRLFADAMR